jgi:hypothetical protein
MYTSFEDVAGVVMSLTKLLAVFPARIEVNRLNRKSAIADRQSKIEKSTIGNSANRFAVPLEENDSFFDVRSRNVYENRQNAEK